MKNQILAVAALAMVFASCQQNKDTEKVASQYIGVDAGMGSLVRATDTDFEDGDQISIYAWAGADLGSAMESDLVVANSVNTLESGVWSAAPPMLWKDMLTPHYFVSIYPVTEVTNFTAHEFILTGVEADDDLLFATHMGGLTGKDEVAVPLTFDHSQSKIIVNLTFRDQFGGTPEVDGVTVTARNIAVVDFTTKITTVKGSISLNQLAIAEQVENIKFESIVVPQTINVITIAIDGKTYIYNNQKGIILLQGKKYTLDLTVGRDGVVVGNVTINGWDSGDTIEGDTDAE